MPDLLGTETLIIELLLIASLVAIAVRRLHIPYTVALVVVGLAVTSGSQIKFELTPELILALFVPPLIFEAAFHLNLNELRRNAAPILALAVPGVLITTFIVGGILSFGTSLSLPAALVFGSLIAATDPIAVVAVFRLLGVPKRLSALVEGESLLNDGTALVLFNLMLAIALTGKFNLLNSLGEFVKVSTGGIMLGLVLGWVFSRLIARIDDYLIEITLTTVLAYGAYLLAEEFGFSGVLAVVSAGLIMGSLGPQGMSPTTRIVLNNFWEYIAFLVNSLVFLLIGMQVDLLALFNAWPLLLWAIGAVLLARAVVVYGLGSITGRWIEPISLRWRHVIAWGGLRGALSLALALSLPIAFGPDRDLIRTMTFGVALFTLLIQATTMSPLVKKLGIITTSPAQKEFAQRHARLTALRSAEAHMERQFRAGLISNPVWEWIKPKIQEQRALLTESVHDLLKEEPVLESEELDSARREILRAQRSAYLGLRSDGVISDEVYEKLSAEVDAVLEDEDSAFLFFPEEIVPELIKDDKKIPSKIAEIEIEAGSVCEGKSIKEITWPENFVITSLKRDDKLLIPGEDTPLKAHDILTGIAEPAALREARQICKDSRADNK
jgi:CPA1 family monovalent cation:H+ antiporter